MTHSYTSTGFGQGTKTWHEGGADDGLSSYPTQRGGSAWRALPGPFPPYAYDDINFVDSVKNKVVDGKFTAGSFTDVPTGDDLDDEWNGAGTVGSADVFGFQADGWSQGFPTQKSGFRGEVTVVGMTLVWDRASADHFAVPDRADWPSGAIGVQIDYTDELRFISAYLEPPTFEDMEIEDNHGAFGVLAFRDAGSGLAHVWNAQDGPVRWDPPTMIRAMPPADFQFGPVPINIDAVRNYDFGAVSGGNPETQENEISIVLGPAPFMTAPAGSMAPPLVFEAGTGAPQRFLAHATQTPLTVTFQTGRYRFIFGSGGGDGGGALAVAPPPLRHTQRDDRLGPSGRNRPARTRQAGHRNTGYL